MNHVFVLAPDKSPLIPCSPARARLLLSKGEAAVFRRYPFTIILKREPSDTVAQPLRLKIDPGSKTTGMAIVHETNGVVIWAAELTHRGLAISASLTKRLGVRRNRRARKTRYRQARFLNRARPQGWLAPSLKHRVLTTLTWVQRTRRYAPIIALSMELARFDTQRMQNPEISGVEYQQGTLEGYESKEYLLAKWGRRCAYCDKTNVPFTVDHLHPRGRGGSDRISNLVLSCGPCNQKKGVRDVREFLADDPARLTRILAQAKAPLRDAAALNATRWALYRLLDLTGLSVEVGTGGRTKFNRVSQGLPKAHWIDAACVGKSTPERLQVEGVSPLLLKATGHNSRQVTRVDRFGFPRTSAKGERIVRGFRTGDTVKAIVPRGKHKGVHLGRVAIRTRGQFRMTTTRGLRPDVNWQHMRRIHAADGYGYDLAM